MGQKMAFGGFGTKPPDYPYSVFGSTAEKLPRVSGKQSEKGNGHTALRKKMSKNRRIWEKGAKQAIGSSKDGPKTGTRAQKPAQWY